MIMNDKSLMIWNSFSSIALIYFESKSIILVALFNISVKCNEHLLMCHNSKVESIDLCELSEI